MLRRNTAVTDVNDFMRFLKNFYSTNIWFSNMSASNKNKIGHFLLSIDSKMLSVRKFISLVHYFSLMRFDSDFLRLYAWDKKIFSFIEKYVDLFNGLNLSSHLFDLAYLGFRWEDLLENQLDLMILSKLNHVDLSLKEISISMQALEYLGAYKHPSVALDEVLHHLLVKIEKEFDLFYQDKHLSNALYVLYRNLFKLELGQYFSDKQSCLINAFGENSTGVELNEHMQTISRGLLYWLAKNKISARHNVPIPGSGFSATIWIPETKQIVEISLGRSLDHRYREKKKSILKEIGYENIVVIDIVDWQSLLTEKEKNDFLSEVFKVLEKKESKKTGMILGFNTLVKAGKRFSDMAKFSEKDQVPDRVKPLHLVPKPTVKISSIIDSLAQDALLYQFVWGVEKYFFKTNQELELACTSAIDPKIRQSKGKC